MKLYWCGPTMGKTFAAKIYPQIVDFDDVAREPFEKLAHKLGMSVRQMKMEMPKEYHELFLKLLDELEAIKEKKYVLVSNAVGLYYYTRFELLLIPGIDEFIRRNVERGGGNAEESWSWYQDLMHKHKLYGKCNYENKYICDLTETLFK